MSRPQLLPGLAAQRAMRRRSSLLLASLIALLAVATLLHTAATAFYFSRSLARSATGGTARVSLRGAAPETRDLAGAGALGSRAASLAGPDLSPDDARRVRLARRAGTEHEGDTQPFAASSQRSSRQVHHTERRAGSTSSVLDVEEKQDVDAKEKAKSDKTSDKESKAIKVSGDGDLVLPTKEIRSSSELDGIVGGGLGGDGIGPGGFDPISEQGGWDKVVMTTPTASPWNQAVVAILAAISSAVVVLAALGRLDITDMQESKTGPGAEQAQTLARELVPRAGVSNLSPAKPEERAKPVETLQDLLAQTFKTQDLIATESEAESFSGWYSRAMEAAKEATTRITDSLLPKGSGRSGPTVVNGVRGSVVSKLRSIGELLDDAQEDIYDETWVSLATYAPILRGYEPIFAFYAEAAEPYNSAASNEAVRGALDYETKSLFSAVDDFADGVTQRRIRMVEKAFAQISLAYDRYLKAGNLYSGYDPVTSTTIFYQGIEDKRLVYTPLALDQPRIRDQVLVMRGPDKGKVGRVIWLGRGPDGTVLTSVVKLDPNPELGSMDRSRKGVREVKAYPYDWIALTRSERQSYLRDLVLATTAAVISCTVVYPLDTIKSRLQNDKSPLPPGGVTALYDGLLFNLGREAPNAGFLMAGFNLLTRQAVALPFVDANNPNVKFLLMIPVGIIANASGIFIRTPFELLNKQIQMGQAKTDQEAIQNVFFTQSTVEVLKKMVSTGQLVLLRGMGFGALQCTAYEIFKERLPLGDFGLPLSAEPLVWGALAGFITGLLTNPPDVILTRTASSMGQEDSEKGNVFEMVQRASAKILEEEGPEGFLKGAWARAAYFAPEAMLWFALYEILGKVTPETF